MPTPILDTAVAWWHADRYDPDVDTQWLDQSGNGHHAQLGSTSGADTNDPTFLPYDGTQYYYFDSYLGTGYGTATSTNASANGVIGHVDVRAKIWMEDWTPSNVGVICNKSGDGTGQIYWRINTDGKLYYSTIISATGRNATSTAAVTPPANRTDPIWLRVTTDGTHIKFWQSDDGAEWTQIGASVAFTYQSNTGSNALNLGNLTSGSTQVLQGAMHKFYLDVGGTVYWDIDFENETKVLPSLANFTDDSAYGNTVSFTKSGWGEGVVVNRDLWKLQGDDFFEVADHDDLDSNDVDISVYLIFRKLTNQLTGMLPLSKGAAADNQPGYYVWISNSETPEVGAATAAGRDTDTTSNILDSAEHGIGFVFDAAVGNTLEAFKDGVGSGSPATSVSRDMRNAEPLRLGVSSHASPAFYFTGIFVGAAIFRSALSDADMLALDAELKSDLTPVTAGGNVDLVHALEQGVLSVGALGQDAMLAGSQVRRWR